MSFICWLFCVVKGAIVNHIPVLHCNKPWYVWNKTTTYSGQHTNRAKNAVLLSRTHTHGHALVLWVIYFLENIAFIILEQCLYVIKSIFKYTFCVCHYQLTQHHEFARKHNFDKYLHANLCWPHLIKTCHFLWTTFVECQKIERLYLT